MMSFVLKSERNCRAAIYLMSEIGAREYANEGSGRIGNVIS